MTKSNQAEAAPIEDANSGEDGGGGSDNGDILVDAAEPGSEEEVRRRARTMSRKQMAREHRKMRARGEILEIVDYWRPTSRSECLEMERPCLFVSCRHHLYLDVNPETGSVKLNFPDKEPWDLEETCALDVADRGGITLEEVGDILNLTRERIRQVEVRGLLKLKLEGELDGAKDLALLDLFGGVPAARSIQLRPTAADFPPATPKGATRR